LRNSIYLFIYVVLFSSNYYFFVNFAIFGGWLVPSHHSTHLVITIASFVFVSVCRWLSFADDQCQCLDVGPA